MYKFRCKSCNAILEKGHVIDFCPVCKSKYLVELTTEDTPELEDEDFWESEIEE
jgi:RNA polymerase subunit RPABC4/transcription elongation factor Spt4